MTDIDLKAGWTILPFSAKLFVLLLTAVAVKATYTTFRILMALSAIKPAIPTSALFKELSARLMSLQQLHIFTFFAFCLSVSVLALEGYQTTVLTHLTGTNFILENFRICCRYSIFVLLILLALHSLQWFTSRRLGTRH